MVSAALILLANDPPEGISPKEIVLPVVVIISREIGISALREWAAAVGRDAHKAVKVSALGKWKTATQMAAMSTMLFCRRARNVTSDPKRIGCCQALHTLRPCTPWSLLGCVWTRLCPRRGPSAFLGSGVQTQHHEGGSTMLSRICSFCRGCGVCVGGVCGA
uniref:Cdp-diacylglycerol--glycerol-3-phosphate 3-phosphatidyltransferase n=1 Tax=Tetraselmis sp. GSL018 TaxID=582737 RepID=A0A061QLX3_9CHLO